MVLSVHSLQVGCTSSAGGCRGTTKSAWECNGTLWLGCHGGMERPRQGGVMPCLGSTTGRPCKGKKSPQPFSQDNLKQAPKSKRIGWPRNSVFWTPLLLLILQSLGTYIPLLSYKSTSMLPRITSGRENPHPNPCSSVPVPNLCITQPSCQELASKSLLQSSQGHLPASTVRSSSIWLDHHTCGHAHLQAPLLWEAHPSVVMGI